MSIECILIPYLKSLLSCGMYLYGVIIICEYIMTSDDFIHYSDGINTSIFKNANEENKNLVKYSFCIS